MEPAGRQKLVNNSLASNELLNLALNTVEVVQNVGYGYNQGGDNYLFRDLQMGRFVFGGNVWDLFREALDVIGGSQGLAELGLI